MRASLRTWLSARILRRQGPDRLPVRLHRRRLYVLPTRAGLAFGTLLLLMLVAGLNYGNSAALFLTFLLIGFALVCMQRCHRNLLGLQVAAADTTPAFAGEHGALRLRLRNDSRLARFALAADALGQHALPLEVPPRGTRCFEIPVHTTRRGRVRIEQLRLTTTHPGGLFRTWTWVHLPLSVTVYPRPHGTRPMPLEGATADAAQPRSGVGEDEWLDLRHFRDGDSPRQVAWKAYARGGPLLVKEYGAAHAGLRLFDFARLAPLGTEARLEQLARWVVDAEACGERYGLALPAVHIPPDRGPEHRHRCLTALALHGLGTDERFGSRPARRDA